MLSSVRCSRTAYRRACSWWRTVTRLPSTQPLEVCHARRICIPNGERCKNLSLHHLIIKPDFDFVRTIRKRIKSHTSQLSGA